MTKSNFRNYLYVSDTKLEQYVGQLNNASLSKAGSEAKIKSPLFDYTVKTEFDSDSTKYTQLEAIVSEVKKRGLLGDLLDYTPWFEATVPVRPLLMGDRVFYVGTLPTSSVMPVSFAFQCSLNHFIGIENHRREIDRLGNFTGIEKKLDIGGPTITLPSVTSSNHMFASALSSASNSINHSENELVMDRDSNPEHYDEFFQSKEDYELHQSFKPSEEDLRILAEYSIWNERLMELTKGWFRGYRQGLLNPPPFSIKQSLTNLVGINEVNKYLSRETALKKIKALKKLHNFQSVTRRITTDSKSKILNNILSVSIGETEGTVNFFGIRLLDRYYRNEGYSSEGRVILASPLFLTSSYSYF